MAYKVTTEGMDELVQKLNKAGKAAEGIAAASLYEGARVVADAISQGAKGVAVSRFRYAAGGRTREPSPEERAMLTSASAAGIAKFEKNGNEVNTGVGYNRTGYMRIPWSHAKRSARTNYQLDGGGSVKPVAVIANAINSGTSFMKKQPFIRKAISSSKGAALGVIEKEIIERVDKLLNEE